MPISSRLRRRASSLVITLALVVLLTIIAIGMFTATRMEVTASKLHLDAVRAGEYSQFGQSAALARLRTAVEGTNRLWASQPGRIIASGTNALLPVTNVFDLHSGQSAATAGHGAAAELNPSRLRDPSERLIVPASWFNGTNAEMKLAWIYVRKDGAFETNGPPAYDAANPVVGRFAFWVDDEGSKVNVNTATVRGVATTNVPSSDPSRVDLASLVGGSSNAVAVAAFRSNNHYFNSSLDVFLVGGAIASAAKTNSQALTHYSHSPNLNMFGERKIVLTTQKSIAKKVYPDLSDAEITNCYVDIFKAGSDDIDPGDVANISLEKAGKVDAFLHRIVAKLDATNWPIQPGKSFTEKYGGGIAGDAIMLQTLADIIEYVRAKESTNQVVEPISYNSATFFRSQPPKNFSHAGANVSLGTTRAPYITEFGVWVPASTVTVSGKKYWPALFVMELYLPEGAGVVDLTEFEIYPSMRLAGSTSTGADLTAPIIAGPPPSPIPPALAYLDSSDTLIRGGQFRKVVIWCAKTKDEAAPPVRPAEVTISSQLVRISNDTLVDEFPENRNSKGTYALDAAGVVESAITSMSVEDPFLGKHWADWKQGPNTFGAPTALSSTVAGLFVPQQDTDASGSTLVTNSARIPARKGTSANPFGIIESVAELGAVHVGQNGEVGPAVPWRTIRLQPLKQGSTDLPDWALLDLFCAPVRTNLSAAENKILRPNGELAGLININQEIRPFENADGTPALARTNALEALLAGARSGPATNPITSSAVSAIIDNLRARTMANAGGNRGRQFSSQMSTNAFFVPGQLIEIAGVADQGEFSEIILRDVLDLTSTRSSVFNVYSVGQSIYQDKAGEIRVLAENRQSRLVELSEFGVNPSMRAVFSKKIVP